MEAEIAGGMLTAPWGDCHTGSAFCAFQLLPRWYLLLNTYYGRDFKVSCTKFKSHTPPLLCDLKQISLSGI